MNMKLDPLSKVKVLLVHVMKPLTGARLHLNLDPDVGQRSTSRPVRTTPEGITHSTQWAPEPAFIVLETSKIYCPESDPSL